MSTTPRISSIRPWLVVGLACLSLLFPLLSVIINLAGGSPASIGVGAEWTWLLVGVARILIVWLTRAPRPLATLVLAGAAGGVLTVIVVAIIQLSSSGSAGILGAPIGMVVMVSLSTLGGLVCGLIAWGLQSVTRKPEQ